MSDSTRTMDDVVAAFVAARGESADADWARRAAARFVLDGIREDVWFTALDDVAVQVGRSGESPRDLYGDPLEWVAGQRRTWQEDGVPTVAVEPPTSLRDLVLLALGVAAMIAAILAVIGFLDGGTVPMTPGIVAGTVALACGVGAVRGAYERANLRWGFVPGVVAGAVALALTTAVTAGLFLGTGEVGGSADVSAWWSVALAGGWLAVIVLVAKLWRSPASPPRPRGDVDDTLWLEQLARALRERHDVTGHDVDAIVAEARQHAADAGTSLADEFGTPGEYASRFARRPGVKARRESLYWIGASVLAAALLALHLADGGPGGTGVWITASWAALSVASAIIAWGRYRRAR